MAAPINAAVASAWTRSPPRGSQTDAVVALTADHVMYPSAGAATRRDQRTMRTQTGVFHALARSAPTRISPMRTWVPRYQACPWAAEAMLAANDPAVASPRAPSRYVYTLHRCPQNSGRCADSSSLQSAIDRDFGSFHNLQKQINAALAGIQGSGWAWLVKDKGAGTLQVVTRANQDPVTGSYVPLMGIDAWEHAYYLQYQNRKAEYFNAIWNVINWSTVANRLEKA